MMQENPIPPLVGKIASFEVRIPPHNLPGTLQIPQSASALVIFVHGSGSGRLSPRNMAVAKALNRRGIATLLFDLLTSEEEDANNRAKVFDIPLLADRLIDAILWTERVSSLKGLRVGLFGASTGAAAALVVAAKLGPQIGAVVARGGRPDLAGNALSKVRNPTLLIVGGADRGVIELNEHAYTQLTGPKELVIVPGATHLFPEHGALEQVIAQAGRWFKEYLRRPAAQRK